MVAAATCASRSTSLLLSGQMEELSSGVTRRDLVPQRKALGTALCSSSLGMLGMSDGSDGAAAAAASRLVLLAAASRLLPVWFQSSPVTSYLDRKCKEEMEKKVSKFQSMPSSLVKRLGRVVQNLNLAS